jgi:DNA gyrase subunit A
VRELIFANTHDELLFFSSKGKVYKLKTFQVPEGSKQSKGIPIVNFLPIDKGEAITTFKRASAKKKFFLFVTQMGTVKLTESEKYKSIRQNGLRALGFKDEKDSLLKVMEADPEDDVLIADNNGKVIRIHCDSITVQGRSATGSRGLRTKDEVRDIAIVSRNDTRKLIVLSERGIGKKTSLSEFSAQGRGGGGVKIMNLNSKTGKLANMLVDNHGEMLITSRKGQIIRISSETLPTISRTAMGVRLFKLDSDDVVSSAILIESSQEEKLDL